MTFQSHCLSTGEYLHYLSESNSLLFPSITLLQQIVQPIFWLISPKLIVLCYNSLYNYRYFIGRHGGLVISTVTS